MTEIWKPISGTDFYEVSNMGRVRSTGVTILRTSSSGRIHQVTFPTKIIKGHVINRRRQVVIHGKSKYVHRLVASAFCPGEAEGKEVNHINGDPTDNRSDNLEWVTRSENIRHSYALGTHPKPVWWLRPAVAVKATNLKTGETYLFSSQVEAAVTLFNDSRKSSPISRCIAGKLKTAYGFTWEKQK